MTKLCLRSALLAAAVFLAIAPIQAQDGPQLHDKTIAPQSQPAQKPATPTVSATAKVVNLLATVRDKHGALVNDLTRDDFKLEEDGRPQSIKYFTRETDLPLTLGLLVDTGANQRRVLDQERTASYKFLQDVLRTKDQAFLIHFDRETELL